VWSQHRPERLSSVRLVRAERLLLLGHSCSPLRVPSCPFLLRSHNPTGVYPVPDKRLAIFLHLHRIKTNDTARRHLEGCLDHCNGAASGCPPIWRLRF
jgi:hypothetical protein